MQQSVCYFLVVVLISLTASTNAIRCFEGNYSNLNDFNNYWFLGRSDLEASSKFFVSDCGADAQYCFHSLDRAMNTQAVCHSNTTQAEHLQICQAKIEIHKFKPYFIKELYFRAEQAAWCRLRESSCAAAPVTIAILMPKELSFSSTKQGLDETGLLR